MTNIKERPLQEEFQGAIPITKFKRMESFENHELKTFFYARMKCKDAKWTS